MSTSRAWLPFRGIEVTHILVLRRKGGSIIRKMIGHHLGSPHDPPKYKNTSSFSSSSLRLPCTYFTSLTDILSQPCTCKMAWDACARAVAVRGRSDDAQRSSGLRGHTNYIVYHVGRKEMSGSRKRKECMKLSVVFLPLPSCLLFPLFEV